MSEPTPQDAAEVDAATRDEEAAEAGRAHVADRPPTDDEARRAEEQEPDEAVAEHFDEMNRIGADVKGEGEI